VAIVAVLVIAGTVVGDGAGLGRGVSGTLGGPAGPGTAAAGSEAFTVAGTLIPNPDLHGPVSPTFPAIDVLLPPEHWNDMRRPTPDQSQAWLNLKAAGRVALVGGEFTILPAGWNPLVNPATSLRALDKTSLNVSYTRWIIEVPGYGYDEKGNYYNNRSYWEFCGNGAMTVVLWYWQQLVGHPNVTGTAGWFLDPYAAEGVAWPSPGPSIAVKNGTRLGTYWSGSDTVSGITAHGRGFEMYLAMKAQPPTWKSTGYSLWALEGKPLYPSFGVPPVNAVAGLNWEISGYDASKNWAHSYYALVVRESPTLARDLRNAVMIDVGRDGVPVMAMADTYNLPNWQDGAKTPHTRHAIAIVGYDNAANPPTYTYTETCGVLCNRRGGNKDGAIHTIPQDDLVKSIQNTAGLGFIW
jgi:hypothetical protein